MTQAKRAYGYTPDKPDARDLPLAALRLSGTLPLEIDLSSSVLEVLDQLWTSRCVAHAWAAALRMADVLGGTLFPPLPSRDFIFYNACKQDIPRGEPVLDVGTYLRSAAKGIIRWGEPDESEWAFNPGPPFPDTPAVIQCPDWEAYRAGHDRRGGGGYYRINKGDLQGIRQSLAAHKPVVFGTTKITDAFEAYTGGVLDLTNAPSLGGHAMVVVGYSVPGGYFKVLNSWNRSWGEAGFVRVSEPWMAEAEDNWAVHR